MNDGDKAVVRPHLERRELLQGAVLLSDGEDVDVIHFPVSCQIANVMTLETGQTLAVSTVGREGVTGLAAFLADEPIGWDAVVHVAGVVWSMPASVLRSQALHSASLRALLNRATHQNQIEAHSRAICATYHPTSARLAQWLLTLQGQTGGTRFTLTQEDMADILGVQRTTVVAAFSALKASGALAPGKRGSVVILDRYALKAAACSCYTKRGASHSIK